MRSLLSTHCLSCHAARIHPLPFGRTPFLKHFSPCISRNHRIIEFIKGLEWTLKIICSEPTLPWGGTPPTSLGCSRTYPVLNTVRVAASTTPSATCCSSLTTLTVKKFFPVSYLNFPSFNLYPLLLVLSLQFLTESLSTFPIGPLQILEGC